MLNKLFHTKAHFYLAILIAFCLPIARLTPVFIALMLLNWLIEGDFKNKFQSIFKNKFALLFISFYLLHLIGLAYTQNVPSGLFDLEVKLSLLVFPVIFVSRPLSEKNKRGVFFALIAGAALTSLMMLVRATYLYFAFGENNFFYEVFSFLIHPSYLSMYLNVAIIWLFINLLQNNFSNVRFANIFSPVLIVFFSFIIVLLSSKLGLLTMILIHLGFLLYYVISRKKYLLGLTGFSAIILLMFSVMSFVPEISGRFNRAVDAVTSSGSNQAEAESTAVRLLIWKAANHVISENFIFGTGTGDAKDELMKEYQNRGMTGAIEFKLNAHNEFYQAFVSLGLIGFLILIADLLFPLWYSINSSNMVYTLFLIVIILNFFTESMFERQAGVMFYAFFNSLLCFNSSAYHPTSNFQNPKSE